MGPHVDLPIDFTAYMELAGDGADQNRILIRQGKMIQNWGPLKDIELTLSGFYDRNQLEGALNLQLQSQIPQLSILPGLGTLPLSPEQLMLNSQLNLELSPEQLTIQAS